MAIKQKANDGTVGLDIKTYIQADGSIHYADIEAPNSSFYLMAQNDIIFRTGGTDRVWFKEDGSVGIGKMPGTGIMLDVDGKIMCGELEIINLTEWKDCVFEKDYSLPSLSEVKIFIDENGHLPGIPSGQEVLDKGYDVGEMDAMLLQKIEELTLYVIELEREIETLKSN